MKQNPYFTLAHLGRGDANRLKGELRRAIADYTEALCLDPLSRQAFSNRGEAYRQLGDLTLALADFSEAIRLEPSNAAIWEQRGVAHLEKREASKAVADFSEAIRLEPTRASAFHRRAEAHARTGAKDKAITDLSQALRLQPAAAETLRMRGNLLIDCGETAKAIADLTEAIRLDPRSTEAYLSRARATAARDGSPDEVIADCTTALELNVLLADAFRLRSSAYAKKGIYGYAAADLTAFLRLAPGNAQDYADRGLARLKQGKFHSAFEDFTHALRMNRTDASVFANRGATLRALKKHDLALRDFTNAMLLDPKYAADYCGQLGLVESTRGDHAQAIAHFSVVLLLDPRDPNAPAWREEAVRARREQKRTSPVPARVNPGVLPAPVLPESPAAKPDSSSEPILLASTSEIDLAVLPPEPPEPRAANSGRGADTDFVLTLPDGKAVAYVEPPVRGDEPGGDKTQDQHAAPTGDEHPKRAPLRGWTDEGATNGLRVGPPKIAPTPWRKPTTPVRTRPARDPDERPKWPLYAGAAVIALALTGGVWAFLANRSAEGRQELPIAGNLTATELWTEYDKDPAAANRKYGNNFVRVKGKIAKIPTNAKVPTVLLDTPNKSKWTIEFVFGSRDDLKGLSAGQEVTIQGECESRGSRPNANLQINTCKVLPGS